MRALRLIRAVVTCHWPFTKRASAPTRSVPEGWPKRTALRSPPPAASTTTPAPPVAAGLGLRAATDAFQLQLIEQTLAAHDGNWAATARALELDGGNLHRLARRLGLKA